MKINTRNNVLISSILLATTSSLCCIVPVITIIGGVAGVSSSFGWLTPLRPYLIVATVLSLGFAFYQAYKPRKKDSCGCETGKKSFVQSKTFVWIIACLTIGLLTFPYYSHIFFTQKQPKATQLSSTNDTVAYFRVIGMTCTSCEEHVNRVLLDEIGVVEAKTSYEDSTTTVIYDKTKVSLVKLMQSVNEKTDYKTTP